MKKIIFLIIIMNMGLLAGCSSGIKFNIGYDQMSGFGMKESDQGFLETTFELVKSLEELKHLCEEWGNPAFNENSDYYTSELSKKIRNYDDDFFTEKSLVIYSFERGHAVETRIVNIEVDGEQLILNAIYKSKKGSFVDESFNWLIIIEVNKLDVVGVTSIQVKHK